jgi:peptidase E
MDGNGHGPGPWRPSGPLREILVLGGHAFGPRPHDRVVAETLVKMAVRRAARSGGARRPGAARVCLLATASGDPAEQAANFHTALAEQECEASDVSLFRLGRRRIALRDHLLGQDLVYVGGGSMVNLLAIWEAHGVPEILRAAWKRGVVLAGQSAGGMCWFERGITRSWGAAASAAGLGFLPGSLCVHYRGEPERRAAYLAAVGRGMPGGYALDDHAGLVWQGESMLRALSFRQGARAFRVQVRGGAVVETPLAARPVRGELPSLLSEDVAELRRVRRSRIRAGALRPGR